MNIIRKLLIVIAVVSVTSAQTINIGGKVTDTGSAPLPGAYVKLEKLGLSATSQQDGGFRLTGSVNTKDQTNQHLSHTVSAKIRNGLLSVNLLERSAVEIILYTVQGKAVSTIQKTMDPGSHSIALPSAGPGVYLYKVKSDRSEFLIKSHAIGGASGGTAVSFRCESSTGSARQERGRVPINDVLSVTKDGYLNCRVIVTNSDTSGIVIKMILQDAGTVTDSDGNVYHAIRIGNQVWTKENLRTTKYDDGSLIPLAIDSAAWVNNSTGAYCYCDNTTNADTIKKYGALYNWYVVGTKKLAPAGWHVATDADWDTVENYLIANGYNYDETTTGNKIAKSMAAKTDWVTSPATGAIGNDLTSNNRSGFSALPAGYRFYDGHFCPCGFHGYWWSATDHNATDASFNNLYCSFNYLVRNRYLKRCGFSVRLVKDN